MKIIAIFRACVSLQSIWVNMTDKRTKHSLRVDIKYYDKYLIVIGNIKRYQHTSPKVVQE